MSLLIVSLKHLALKWLYILHICSYSTQIFFLKNYIYLLFIDCTKLSPPLKQLNFNDLRFQWRCIWVLIRGPQRRDWSPTPSSWRGKSWKTTIYITLRECMGGSNCTISLFHQFSLRSRTLKCTVNISSTKLEPSSPSPFFAVCKLKMFKWTKTEAIGRCSCHSMCAAFHLEFVWFV